VRLAFKESASGVARSRRPADKSLPTHSPEASQPFSVTTWLSGR
jgi:hypothetical protein